MNNLDVVVMGVKMAIEDLKIPEPKVYFIERNNLPNPNITSLFIQSKYELVFNESWVLESDPVEVLVACFHEARHAYQKHSIDNNINENKDTLCEWNNNYISYNSPSGNNTEKADINYLEQAIEVDAILYAHKKMKELFNVKTIIPDSVKRIVKLEK